MKPNDLVIWWTVETRSSTCLILCPCVRSPVSHCPPAARSCALAAQTSPLDSLFFFLMAAYRLAMELMSDSSVPTQWFSAASTSGPRPPPPHQPAALDPHPEEEVNPGLVHVVGCVLGRRDDRDPTSRLLHWTAWWTLGCHSQPTVRTEGRRLHFLTQRNIEKRKAPSLHDSTNSGNSTKSFYILKFYFWGQWIDLALIGVIYYDYNIFKV